MLHCRPRIIPGIFSFKPHNLKSIHFHAAGINTVIHAPFIVK